MKLKTLHIMPRGLFVLAFVLISQLAFAQQTVTGTLTDAESGDPLIGAYILAVGTTTGAVTDFDGNYSVTVPEGVTELQFSYTGYSNQTIVIGNQSIIDLAMASGQDLEEVVVIGYGTVKREDATGSVETVSAESFNQGAVTSAQELVSGKVSGVQITTDGSPGGGATIRIRGGSSLSASNDPLIIIDGVPLPTDGISGSRNPLNLINPNDIETFTVLKDASATAIYGSRASNGVIIITTKKGAVSQGKIRLSYNGKIGVSNAIQTVDVLNAEEFRALVIDRTGEGSTQANRLGNADSDWQDEIFRTALFHDHNVSASGAVGFMPYRVSLGYTNQEGVLLNDRFERITYGVNLSPNFFDNRLQINAGVKGILNDNRFADRGAIGAALSFDPTQPVRTDNAFGNYTIISQANGDPEALAPANPLALLEQRQDQTDVRRYIANFTADYRFSFLPALRANLNLATDRSNSEGSLRIPGDAAFAFEAMGAGGADNSFTQNTENDLLEFYLNYAEDITDGIRLDLLGGYSWQHFDRSNTFMNADIDGSDADMGEDAGEYFLVSLFSRANLSIGERLTLTGTLRRDGSSRFNEDNRNGLFPSGAVAYRLIDVDNNPKGLNRLKLRVGYGITGQQEVGGFYPSQPQYVGSQLTAQYQFGDRRIVTLRPDGYNSNLKWEETTTINLAADFGFFDDRLTGTVEVYNRQTDDLLNFIPVPAGTNLTNFITSNVGDLEVNGFEFSLTGTPIKTENSALTVSANFTVNDVEITRLTAVEDPDYEGVLVGGIAGAVGRTVQVHSVGFAPSSFYVFEQVYDESGIPVEGVFVDRNGDGVVDNGDLYRYENPAPNSFLGLTVNYEIGKFDMSTGGRASFGNYVYDNNLSNLGTYNPITTNAFATNVLAETREVDFSRPQPLSDYYVRDASFFRLDHITAGYRFDDLIGDGSSVRTYLSVQNPLLITDYRGIDPEVFGGIDNTIYPRARTIVFGVGANF